MSTRPVVLVVEDEPFIRMSIADALTALGFLPLEAQDAVEAIALLHKRSDIEIVFTDINLGTSIDGVQLLKKIARRWSVIRLFATSGAVGEEILSNVPSGTRFFSKPYSHAEVATAFRAALAA